MAKRKNKAIVWKAVLEHYSGETERVILPASSRSEALRSLPEDCEVLYLKPFDLFIDASRLYQELSRSFYDQDEIDLIIRALHNYLSEDSFM